VWKLGGTATSVILVIYDEELDATVNDHLARRHPGNSTVAYPAQLLL
jgi:hypothetical protein